MQQKILRFSETSFKKICRKLARQESAFAAIIKEHGYPPMWTRKPTFQTLILFILEQQVSLAAAYAAFEKLRQKIGYITPAKILAMTDEELRSCYFSRQKIVYARELAAAVKSRRFRIKEMANLPDEEVRKKMIVLKGIGHWTIDVYLMHCLQRTDLFPLGDIALVNSLKETKNLSKDTSHPKMLEIAEAWRPYRTIAAMILWHSYIKKRNIKLRG